MKKIFLIFFSAAFGFMSCCSHDGGTEPKKPVIRQMSQGEKHIIESSEKFGLEFFRQLNGVEGDKNIFVSPLSVSMALGMTYNGAADATESAMRKTLQYGDWTNEEINASYKSLIDYLSRLDAKVQFQIANSIWYRLGFEVEQPFLQLNNNYFYAVVQALDFNVPTATDVINSWVKQNTHERIEKIVDSIDPATVMFLINAIYFKGTWTYEFKKSDTRNDKFYTDSDAPIDCQMMRQTNNFLYFENSDLQAIELPYGAGNYSMIIFLPRPQKSIDELVVELGQGGWARWIAQLSKASGLLELPKFELEFEKTLNDVLILMGMEIAFNPGGADFTKISKSGELYISEVKHKSYVNLDEEGTEAAAVTSVEIRVTSAGGDALDFTMRADHPFLFAIREKNSDTILFIGKIQNPNPSE